VSPGRPRRASPFALTGAALRLGAAFAAVALWSTGTNTAWAYQPLVNFQLQCMGCHLADGSGESGRVPSIRRSLVLFSQLPEGRQYVIRVPGVAQSPLSDEETAALLNWMARNLSDVALPPDFVDYSAAEIRRWRSQPLAEVSVVRARLMSATAPQPDPLIAHDSILGFSAPHAAAQHRLESVFQSLPSAGRAREWHRTFTTEPHPAASAENNRLAALIAREWRKQGWENVRLRRYDVLHSRPRSVTLEMTAPVRFKASLREDPVDGDPDTKNPRIDAAYFGYSTSGDVTAELVYANGGNPEDYDLLRQNGISVKGKVVIVRYSNPYSYRGFKALTAEREGAAALLIYSDPAGDGYARGAVFPDGPWGPPSHIQHGAITYDYIVPGDPTTPGWASVPGAKRIPASQARSLPKIPALPLSWRDAKPLLEHMSGAEVPPEWRGALPITYRFTGAVRVHAHVDMDTSIKPYTVVEARIRGSDAPDEWVLVGNHRDAWVYGGVDPVSGTAAMMELTRSLGDLKLRGMRPRRTILVCSWDGEEYALTGSTEWGEQFATDLKGKLIAYINVDEAVAGAAATAGPDGLRFEPSAVASLAPMLLEASKDVSAPSGKSLYEAWRATAMRDQKLPAPPSDSELVETRIGSGSDHTVFLNHLGRPVMNLGFTGDYGVYHSAYDDHFWMTRLGDPTFGYHTALTRIWGLVTLRLANADILPYDFAANGAALQGFLAELQRANKIDLERLPLTRLKDRIGDFEQAGEQLRAVTMKDLAAGETNAEQIQRLNEQLLRVESNWLDPKGIPGRPWFQHLLYAARYTYAHLEFPGLTEAVEAGNWGQAQEQADLLEAALLKNTQLLRSAAADWSSGRKPASDLERAP
jgi:N-acetylated-alpha-linked acidic dipeptidase